MLYTLEIKYKLLISVKNGNFFFLIRFSVNCNWSFVLNINTFYSILQVLYRPE